MTSDTNNHEIPAPADGKTLETWGRLIAREEFDDQNADFYGRPGQKQHGIDIIATKGSSVIGIQCKYRSSANDIEIKNIFSKDFEDALKKNDPPLTKFIFMTTYPNSVVLQDFAAHLQLRESRKGRDIKVCYWGIETVKRYVKEHPKVRNYVFREYQEISEESYKLLAQPWLNKINSGQPSIGLDGLLELDIPSLPQESKACLYTSIGRVYEKINSVDQAKIFIQKAIDIDNKSQKGRMRSAYLEQLNEKHQKCVNLTIKLLKEDMPDKEKQEIAFLHLTSYAQVILVEEEPLKYIPENIRKSENVCIGHVYILDILKIPSHNLAKEYLDIYPNNFFLKVRSAQAPLSEIEIKLGKLDFDYTASDEEVEILLNCKEKFTQFWEEVKNYEPEAIGKDIPFNLILVSSWLGESSKSFEIIIKLIDLFPDWREVRHLYIDYLQVNKNSEQFKNYISTLEEEEVFWNCYLLEKYLHEDKIDEAEKLYEKIDIKYLRQNESHEGIFTALAKLAFKIGDIQLARTYLGDERRINPKIIQPYLFEIEMLESSNKSKKEVKNIIKEVISNIDKTTSLNQRQQMATFLIGRNYVTEALYLLHKKVPLKIPSSALYTYLELLLKDDTKRTTLRDIFDTIPQNVHEELKTEPLYIKFLITIGDLAEAERRAKHRAKIESSGFHDKWLYAYILYIRGNISSLKDYLSNLPEIPFSEDPELLFRFGHMNFIYGNAKKGIEQIYASCFLNQGNAQSCEKYISFILVHGEALLTHITLNDDSVDIGDAVHLKCGEQCKVWVIEDDHRLKREIGYVLSGEPAAKKLLNKKLNETITLNEDTGIKWKIINIQRKEIYLFEKIQNFFWEKHGLINGLKKITIDKSLPPEQQYEPLLKPLRDRSDRIYNCWTLYQNEPLAFRTFCLAIGSNVTAVYDSLGTFEGNLKVCTGTLDDDLIAIEAIRENQKSGFVADLLTYRVIFKLDLLEILKRVLGRAYITMYSKEKINCEMMKLSSTALQCSGLMAFNEGKYSYTEYTEEDKNTQRKDLQDFKNFLDSLEEVLAIGESDIRDHKKIENDPGFFDDALATSGKNCILLSEDWAYRNIAIEGVLLTKGKLKATWLQPALQAAVDESIITREEYHHFVWQLISNKHYFTTISSDFLLYCVFNNDIDIQKVIESFISSTSDLESLYRVFLEFLNLLWDAELPEDTRRKTVLNFLEYWFATRGKEEGNIICIHLLKNLSSEDAKKIVKEQVKK